MGIAIVDLVVTPFGAGTRRAEAIKWHLFGFVTDQCLLCPKA
jgi:hypothetical protein